MFLVNPPTYLSVSAFRAEANDYDLSGYTDAQLQDILVRASGKADSHHAPDLPADRRERRVRGIGHDRADPGHQARSSS